MDNIPEAVFVAVVRESVSLAVLLVFGFFAYQLGKELLAFLRDWGQEVIDKLDEIASGKK